jgi:RNA polymerase sigma factor (sigma-70 family)
MCRPARTTILGPDLMNLQDCAEAPQDRPVSPPDSARFAAIVTAYEGALVRYAARILRDRDRARDVVQDTFVRMMESGVDPSDARIKQWLYTVCRNRAIDLRRKDARLTHGDAPEPAVEPSEENDRAVTELFDQVAEMPARRVQVLELRYREGHSYRRIAELTGMSVSHVGVVIHKSVAALRRHMAVSAALVLLVAGAAWTLQADPHASWSSPGASDASPFEAELVPGIAGTPRSPGAPAPAAEPGESQGSLQSPQAPKPAARAAMPMPTPARPKLAAGRNEPPPTSSSAHVPHAGHPKSGTSGRGLSEPLPAPVEDQAPRDTLSF